MKRTTIIPIVLAIFATGAWANGSSEAGSEAYSYSRELTHWEPSSTVWHEKLNDEVIDLFGDEGIDADYLNMDPAKIPTDIRESIDEVVVEQGEDLTGLIYPDLKAVLSRGEVESAFVFLGSYRIETSFYGYETVQ